MRKEKRIEAKMQKDFIEPYSSYGFKIPIVQLSTHPQWKPGTRLDFGFVQCALNEGYTIIIHP